MDKELKKKWVEALKSGEYTQTTGQLKDKTGYCCLGVLCEVAKLKIGKGGNDVVIDDRRKGYQPIEEIIGVTEVSVLYQMNDSEGKSFKQIATYIQKTL